ncbi:hypothetical protein OP10G_1854 [Fimbriimonas ginsengisoli Gsoil 348]|uniref:Uncharacterized protein n=1 Tax=Fimbriimonas ginsengisoli Gsoil 348 TaxID=661478 RepID=A0A068NPC3_FIMGI|nr:hypothetical protein OP10G_1854 [Fimbriimonas ginsengisoli Gsoil 348]
MKELNHKAVGGFPISQLLALAAIFALLIAIVAPIFSKA